MTRPAPPRAAGFLDDARSARRTSMVLVLGTFLLLNLVAGVVVLFLGGHQDPTYSEPDTRFSELFSFSPTTALWTALAVAAYLLIAYAASTRATLAFSHARPAGPEHAQVQNLLDGVSIAAGIPSPKLYVIDDPAPNAFAAGHSPRSAVVAVTTGLVAKLSRRELEGVLAHEVGHVVNRDIRISTFSVLSVAVIAFLAEIALRLGLIVGRGRDGKQVALAFLAAALLLYVLALPAAVLLRAGLSRRREALADATAVGLTRNPAGLRQALEKLEADTTVVQRASSGTAHLWVESPTETTGLAGLVGRLLQTHPPIASRIAALRTYEGLDPASRGPVDPPSH